MDEAAWIRLLVARFFLSPLLCVYAAVSVRQNVMAEVVQFIEVVIVVA